LEVERGQVPFISPTSREVSCKIVYCGPGLGGKTTNLLQIRDRIPSKSRGRLVSIATRGDRTLFFDFLPMELGQIKGYTTRFHLYTVPGQVHYEASRRLILKGADGIVFVVDSQRDRLDANIESLYELERALSEQGMELATLPAVIQYNKRDLDDICNVDVLEKELNPMSFPKFEAVATRGEGVVDTLKTACKKVLAGLA
jgi:signal recognition particle receptor subunit beta